MFDHELAINEIMYGSTDEQSTELLNPQNVLNDITLKYFGDNSTGKEVNI